MKVSKIKYEDLTHEIVDKILYDGIEERITNTDCIMVLGSTGAVRHKIPKAAEIYHNKYAPKILVSGGMIRETEYGNTSEAFAMKEKLLELDVPPEDILVEDTSQYTIENFVCSLLVLQRAVGLHKIKSIQLVTALFHMRRSLMISDAYIPKWIKIHPCFSTDGSTLRLNWFSTEKHSKRARDEAYKISCYIREGCIADFEI